MTTLTLLGHSAVRLTDGDRTLVIDPGVYSDLAGLAHVGAVLVSHVHPDHCAVQALADAPAPVWGTQDVIRQLEEAGADAGRLHVVSPGDRFTAAGFEVTVAGTGDHAEIFPGMPVGASNAYLVDGVVLHPGDALPDADGSETVRLLLLPVAAPWLRLAESVTFARAFPDASAVPIHDATLSDAGKELVDRVLTGALGADSYRRPAAGEAVSV
jgi:L-ascorbate metabolism protein UlaG (beta-lactamase superfamily)